MVFWAAEVHRQDQEKAKLQKRLGAGLLEASLIVDYQRQGLLFGLFKGGFKVSSDTV